MKRPACSFPAGSDAPTVGVSEGGPRCQTKTKWYFPQNTNVADVAQRGTAAARRATSSPQSWHTCRHDGSQPDLWTQISRARLQVCPVSLKIYSTSGHNPPLLFYSWPHLLFVISHLIQPHSELLLNKPPSCLDWHWEKGFEKPRKSKRVLSRAASPGSSVKLRGMLQEAPSGKNSRQLLSLTVHCISSL